jgi:pimeloyl-ACP methyl ester carboxylesterase
VSTPDVTLSPVLEEGLPPVRHHRVRGLELAYRSFGRQGGPTVVLVHGLGSQSLAYARAARRLAETHRVVMLDLPGHGRSAKPEGYAYSMEAYADAVAAVLEAAGVEGAVVVGHSMGGQIALTKAIRGDRRLRALVLLNPAGIETFDHGQSSALRAAASADHYHGLTREQLGALLRMAFHRFDDDAEALLEVRWRKLRSAEGRRYARAVERSIHGMLDAPVRPRLDRVRVPTVVVFGSEDRLIPNRLLNPQLDTRKVAEDAVQAIPGARLEWIEGAGHMLPTEAPDAVVDAVRSLDLDLGTAASSGRR